MNNPPLLSVVIATKNRQKYCIEAIQSILAISSDLIQIAIADNSDTPDIQQYLEANPNSQVIYTYDGSPLSSIDNFNKCVSLATGEYVIMIGDDDTVLPNIIETTQWMKLNNIESIGCKSYIDFIWPNNAHVVSKNGRLIIPGYSNKIEEINIENNLTSLIKSGFINYQRYNLPRIYHGIVKRALLETVFEKVGYFYGGLTPDMYSTVALSNVTKVHYIVDYPFSVAGACQSSTSVSSLSSDHSGYLSDAPHFKNRTDNYNWEKQVPRFYSVETIWAETGVKALYELGRADLVELFDIYKLSAYAILANLKYIKTSSFRRLIFLFRLSITEGIKIHKPLKINYFKHVTKLVSTTFSVAFDLLKSKKNQPSQPSQVYTEIYGWKDVLGKLDDTVFRNT
ncbi:glycosyltransferase family 2 protein [Mucilaginibacter jinjuensis]|uniref:Glycosyltransferase family 2 protein n=1 Tax=Mucilaginibacter jinjuensis TaxID=1176721 RepID=A0ABY7TA08_9SPHI|nr:glycosyltransferase family 2 protein [Mucilaginibacter jinjuensis]WCT13166.1 glycosyltransferase family 2 protein [Mucilaginibacter jinjuensis]